jgi:carboxyl-terminal processing protease
MLEALKALEKEGVNGYIFDLRNNSGGLLTEAINISSLFLEKDKTVVYTRDR